LSGQAVSLIKMDAEGHEAKILAGAVNLIARYRPLILCELLSDRAAELRATFEGLGYRGVKVFRADWLFMPAVPTRKDVEVESALHISPSNSDKKPRGRGLFSVFSRDRGGR